MLLSATGTVVMLTKIKFIMTKEELTMNYFRIMTILLLPFIVIGLTACGGGEGDDSAATPTVPPVTSPPVEELNSDEILADPNASFKTSKAVEFAAYNESDTNITFFVFDNLGTVLARYYIDAGSFADVNIQLAAAEQTIAISWNYREHFKKQDIELADLTQVNFSGF